MSMDRGTDKEDVVHTYNGLLLSHKRMKQRHLQQYGCIILSEIIQTEKENITFLKQHKWTYLQNRNRRRDLKTKVTVTKGEMWWGVINQELGMNTHTLLYSYTRQITSKDLLFSTGNSTQCSVIIYMGKNFLKRMNICTCIIESLSIHLKLTQYCKSIILQ